MFTDVHRCWTSAPKYYRVSSKHTNKSVQIHLYTVRTFICRFYTHYWCVICIVAVFVNIRGNPFIYSHANYYNRWQICAVLPYGTLEKTKQKDRNNGFPPIQSNHWSFIDVSIDIGGLQKQSAFLALLFLLLNSSIRLIDEIYGRKCPERWSRTLTNRFWCIRTGSSSEKSLASIKIHFQKFQKDQILQIWPNFW